jgi:hypothetical protein
MTFHNKYGLIGANTYELGVNPLDKIDRSKVLPFSVLKFDSHDGWRQDSVYATLDEALNVKRNCKTTVVDTHILLDIGEYIMHLMEK